MATDLVSAIQEYNVWTATFDKTPANYVKWRQRYELWRLVADVMDGERPSSDIEDWWYENTDA